MSTWKYHFLALFKWLAKRAEGMEKIYREKYLSLLQPIKKPQLGKMLRTLMALSCGFCPSCCYSDPTNQRCYTNWHHQHEIFRVLCQTFRSFIHTVWKLPNCLDSNLKINPFTDTRHFNLSNSQTLIVHKLQPAQRKLSTSQYPSAPRSIKNKNAC